MERARRQRLGPLMKELPSTRRSLKVSKLKVASVGGMIPRVLEVNLVSGSPIHNDH